MKKGVSHLAYLVFFLLGAYIAFRGVEDFGLLLFGKVTDATVTEVTTQNVRVGKRGHGVKYYAKYEFSADDKNTYVGDGEMDGQTPRQKGAVMPIRYMSFHPSVNAPKDDVLGNGAILTIIGGFISVITAAAWKRKLAAAPPPAASASSRQAGERKSVGPKSRKAAGA
jgi:hypothetical protein